MGQHRRKYADEFKAAAVERLYEPDATQGSVAKELGITGTPLKTWRLEIEAFGSAEAKRRHQADAAELARLRKENKRPTEEVEILHKASTFFRDTGGETITNKHAFVTAHKAQYAVSTLCRVLKISRSWFYGFWASQPARHQRNADRDAPDLELLPKIKTFFKASKNSMDQSGSIRTWRPMVKPSLSGGWRGL